MKARKPAPREHFRRYLSAFLTAARSVTGIIAKKMRGNVHRGRPEAIPHHEEVPMHPWVPDQMWETPLRQRNSNAIYDPQPPFVPPPLQQPVWVPDTPWEIPRQSRNNALLDSQPAFVPPPMPPPPTAGAGSDEIEAAFQEVLRLRAEEHVIIDRLRNALAGSTAREIGPGHNQGPPLQIEELDDESKQLLALLMDKGPRPAPADRAPIIEQAKKTLERSERIKSWLKNAATAAALIGVHEVTKDLTAPLWEALANKMVDLYHAIEVWISLLL
jgi:hypothetical protein